MPGFGSRFVSPSTGILMNNGIMWFDPRPGRPNSLAPAKRPLCNMCPVILARDGITEGAFAAGAPRALPSSSEVVYEAVADLLVSRYRVRRNASV